MNARDWQRSIAGASAVSALGLLAWAAGQGGAIHEGVVHGNARDLLLGGREVFRYDTFGSEAFWGDALRLHEAIAGVANGGTGPGVSPVAALGLGLKVDVDALPPDLVADLRAGLVDLEDPATTLALLRLEAVVGVHGVFDDEGAITSVGIQCALCHSTVDDSFAPGIGGRLDGWPNRDLDVGKVIATAPDLSPFVNLLGVDAATVVQVLESWGPGRFDAHLTLDGKAFRPDGRSASVLIPAAFGLAGVNLATYTGWGSVPYWNALVGTLEMHGLGRFYDPRLRDPAQFPVAAANGLYDVVPEEDLLTPKLAALHHYQLSLPAPEPPPGSFDPDAAERGRELFTGKARCAECHVPPLFSDPGWNLHFPDEIGIDSFQADRSPTGAYRTTPLRGLFARAKGGYYHDGRFADLDAVVEHYDAHLGLVLSPEEADDLVAFLSSL